MRWVMYKYKNCVKRSDKWLNRAGLLLSYMCIVLLVAFCIFIIVDVANGLNDSYDKLKVYTNSKDDVFDKIDIQYYPDNHTLTMRDYSMEGDNRAYILFSSDICESTPYFVYFEKGKVITVNNVTLTNDMISGKEIPFILWSGNCYIDIIYDNVTNNFEKSGKARLFC